MSEEHLTLKVKAQDGNDMFFKVKPFTQLKKLMDVYCSRSGLNPLYARFLYDGERLNEASTPQDLNMEDGDEIDVMVEQTGGFVFS